MKALPPYRGVVAFTGLPGSAKSYSLVELGVAALRAGVRVFSNAGFEIIDHEKACNVAWADYYLRCAKAAQKPAERRCVCRRRSELYFSLEELLTVPNGCVVLLDEAPVYVNSRKSSEFPRGLLYRMTQVRHDGLRFYYSAIDEMMVDVNMRRVTFWTQRCRRLPFNFFVRSLWPPIDRVRPEDKSAGRKFFRLRDDVMTAYNTHGKVWVPPETLESLLQDVVKPWVPLTDELVDLLWSGGRDPERARELLADLKAGRLTTSLPSAWKPPVRTAAAQGASAPGAAVADLVARRYENGAALENGNGTRGVHPGDYRRTAR